MAHFSLEMTSNSEKAQRKIKFKLVTESESQSIQFQESVNETISVNFNDNEYSSWDFDKKIRILKFVLARKLHIYQNHRLFCFHNGYPEHLFFDSYS